MPDEATAPVEEQETPSSAASEEEIPAEEAPAEIDWKQRAEVAEKRHSDLVPEYTRGQQQLAAIRGDHGTEAQVEALRQYNVEVEMAEEAEEDDPFEDPTERLEKRLEAQEQKFAQREEAEQQAHFEQLEANYITSTLGEIAGNEGVKLSDTEKKIIKNNALANRLEDGRPDLQGAFDDLKGIKSAAAEEYRASKNTPVPPIGSAGEDKIDLRDPKAKRDFIQRDFEARQAADEGS